MNEWENGEKRNTFKVSKDEEIGHIERKPRSSRISERKRW